jgi:hypothetical protein
VKLAPHVRRTLAVSLVSAGLVLLASRAAVDSSPIGTSLGLARKFWTANATEKVANNPGFRGEARLAIACLELERKLPVTADARLVVDPSVPPVRREQVRFAVAYRLAPRRVFVVTRPIGAGRFAVEPADGTEAK